MRTLHSLLLWSASLVLLLAGAPAARAEVMELRTGDLVPGQVESIDADGLTFTRENGGSIRVTWDLVVPRCRYDLTKGSLAAHDAAGRVALAKWGASEGFYRAARRDLLEAQGLGYAGDEDLDALLAAARKDEADATIESVDALVASDDLDAALDRLKGYLRAADPGADADRVRARVGDVVQRIERRDEAAREADAAAAKAAKDGRIQAWIEKTLAAADASKEAGGEAAADAFAQVAKGNQTRSRNALAKAESKYQSARASYLRVKKVVKQGPVFEECAERIKDCDGRTVEVLVRWGRLEVGNKNWRAASPIVDRGLKIDPVQPELLDLRQTIDKNWIRKKLSDVTGARGHASSF